MFGIGDSKDPLAILGGPSYVPETEQEKLTTDEIDLVGQIKEKMDQAISAKQARARSWEFNRLQLKGEQNIVQDAETGDVLRLINEDSDALQSVDNILQPTSRAFVGKMVRIIPSGIVLPRSEDRSDMEAADVMDSYLDYRWRVLKMKIKYKRAVEYLPWAGTGILQLQWNTLGGPKTNSCGVCAFSTTLSNEEKAGDQCPLCASEGIESILEELRDGDMELVLHDPRDFYPEPGVSEIKDMSWCFTKTAQPVSTLRQMYPDRAGLITEEEGIHADQNTTYAVGLSGPSIEAEQLKGHAYHVEFHAAPTGEYPEGRIIFLVNDRIMRVVTKNVYHQLFGRFGFYAIRADRYAREFWGSPPIDQAWLLQHERNTLCTQVREHRELTNNPKVLVPDGCGLDVDRWNTTPGEVLKIKTTPGGKPTYLTPPALAQYVYSEFDRLKRAIQEKFGVTDQEMGMSPPDQSGRFAAIVEAQSSESVAPIVLENIESWMDLHRDILLLGQRFDPPEKVWAIPGTDRPQSYAWDQVNIRAGWDLIIADEDALSKNPALRLQQAILLWDKGLYLDASQVPDKKAFMRHAGLRMPGMGPDIDSAHRAYAAQIPDMLERQIQVIPKPWDDPKICAEELIVWLRGEGLHKPDWLVQQVAQLWMLYSMTIQPQTMQEAAVMPNQGMQQASQGPQNPAEAQGPGTGEAPAPSVPAEAAQNVANADSAAASAAAMPGMHEGSTL